MAEGKRRRERRQLVLFIGLAASREHDSAGVAEELAELEALFLHDASTAASFELISQPFGVSIDAALAFIRKHQPHILHFAGHAEVGGGLVFETGGETLVAASLADRISGLGVEVVVLNGCGTAAALNALVRHRPGEPLGDLTFAVGHSKRVRPDDACRFTRDFYATLARTGGQLEAAVAAVRRPLTAADVSYVHLARRLPAPVDEKAYAAALRRMYGKLLGLADALGADGGGAAYRELGLADVFVSPGVQECYDGSDEMGSLAADLGLSPGQIAKLVESGQLERPGRKPARRWMDDGPLMPLPLGVSALVADASRLRLVVLGEAGSGKSSALRMAALHWATQTDAARRAALPLPLLVELRQFAEYLNRAPGASLAHFIADGGGGSGRMDFEALTARLALPDPHVLLLLDGLDEVFEEGLREAVLRAVRALPRSIRVVISSRIIGYLPSWLQAWDFAHFRIQPLTDEQTRSFVQLWHAKTYDAVVEAAVRDALAARLIAALQGIPQLRELARNPLLLTMIALLNRRSEDLPSRRVQVLEECARLLVHCWKVEDAVRRALPVDLRPVDFDRKVALLADLAWTMGGVVGDATGDGDAEGGSDAYALVGNLVDRRTLLRLCEVHAELALGPAAAPAAAYQIVERLHDHHGVLSFLGGSSYAFAHRAFLEYFCARRVAMFVEDDEWDNGTLQHWFARRAQEPAWADVLTLVCGILPSKRTGPCLSAIVDVGQVMLAARCVEQLRDRARAKPHVDRVRAALLDRALRGKRDDDTLTTCSLAATLWHDDATRNAMLAAASSRGADDCAMWTLLKHWPGDAAVVRHASTATELKLQSLGLYEADAESLRVVMRSMPQLQQLDLGRNDIGEAGARALADALLSVPQLLLQQLHLQSNSIGDDGARALADALLSVPQLQQFHLQSNTIGDDGAHALAEALRSVPQLQQLHLQSNSIGEAGACDLAEALCSVPQLQQLVLSYNSIGEAGACAFAEALRSVPQLQQLDLGWNSIGEAGICALAKALPSMLQLWLLCHSGNSIGEAGARAFAEALRSLPQLRWLWFGGNGIGDAGARALAEALGCVPQLGWLWLDSNSIGEAGACALAEALRSLPQLQQLSLGSNSIGEALTQAAQLLPSLRLSL